CLKQMEQVSRGHVVCCIAATFMLEDQNGYIDGREHLDVHRNGQGLFLPHAMFKTNGASE
ncbi:hypothetical protein V7166_02775, partial [Bacillus thuringiensis]